MQIKILRLISIISIFIVIVSIFPNIVFADDTGRVFSSGDSWASYADDFLKASEGKDIGINKDKLNEASSDIYNTLTSLGMIISVIVGLILGITYMMASAEDKAKVKESLIPYIVGCTVIFGAFGIWKIVVNTFNGL